MLLQPPDDKPTLAALAVDSSAVVVAAAVSLLLSPAIIIQCNVLFSPYQLLLLDDADVAIHVLYAVPWPRGYSAVIVKQSSTVRVNISRSTRSTDVPDEFVCVVDAVGGQINDCQMRRMHIIC